MRCFEIELFSTFCILDQNKTQKEEAESKFERSSKKKFGFDYLNLAKMSENNTGILALDCETVGVEKWGKFTTIRRSNEFNNLARVSIVNQKGDCIYDRYVKPTQEVKEYRYRIL